MVRVLLRFPEKIIDQPITSQVILEHGIPLNILSAHIAPDGGEILVDIPSVTANKIIQAFRAKGVNVVSQKLISVDDEVCIDCGACTSLCPVSAISLTDDFSVVFNEEKCLGITCALCVDTCPVRAIQLGE